MNFGRRKRQAVSGRTQIRTAMAHPYQSALRFVPLGTPELRLYQAMREAIPVLDAAIVKLVRLTGGFTVACADKTAEAALQEFLRTVPCGRGQRSIHAFLDAYLDSLLTYGRAVGEMVVDDGHLRAVCWGDVSAVHIKEGQSPLDFTLCVQGEDGQIRPLPCQELLLFTTLNPEPANPYGVSMLRSMPFLADVLLKIFATIGSNWERAGNIRYSVVCKPGNDALDAYSAADRANQMAQQWSQAMEDTKNGTVRDFVAVGDVHIQAIGADAPILDSDIPVRQILEQLIARTGLPPFLLGLSWASTERMSSQQADMLTSELWALRRTLTPVLERICELWLALEGFGGRAEILWEDISLQDILDEAQAAYYRAKVKGGEMT